LFATDVCEHGGLANATLAFFAAAANFVVPTPPARIDSQSAAMAQAGKCLAITACAAGSESNAAVG
jgi:hypothetical protein